MLYDELKIKDIKGVEDLSLSQLSNVLRFANTVNHNNVKIQDFLSLNASFLGMETSEERYVAINYLKELAKEKENITSELPDSFKLYNAIIGAFEVEVEPHYIFAMNKGVKALRHKDYDTYVYNVDINKMVEAIKSVVENTVIGNNKYTVKIL